MEFRAPALENEPLGALHVEEVALPLMFPDNVTVPPAQTVCGDPALAVAVAFTVTIAVIGLPTQKVGAGPVGVMVKVTVTDEEVVLVKAAPVIFPDPLAAIPVTFPVDKVPLSLVQANVVPDTTGLVPKVIVVNEAPEQMV